jgi:choline dehydrogenase-like flavoprotein
VSGGYHAARRCDRDLELETDVVVIGSGAGGAVVAAELAEAGQRVVVLEEGPHVPAAEIQAMRPSQHQTPTPYRSVFHLKLRPLA